MSRKIITSLLSICSTFSLTQAAVVFTDDMSTADNWTVDRSAVGAGTTTIPDANGRMVMQGTGTTGQEWASTETGNFTGDYDTTLSNNDGVITWTFNMRQNRANLSVAGSGTGTSIATILGSTSADFSTSSGYAVVVGEGDATDSLRLVSFSGGFGGSGSLTDVIKATDSLTDIGTEFLSVKVTLDTATNTWELFGRDDSGTFADPTTVTTSVAATAIDSTFTNTALTHSGFLFQHPTGQNAFFDNLTVDLTATIPEPSTYALIFSSIAFGALFVTRRKNP